MRERVLTTLKHEELDKVPIDLDSTPTTGIHVIPYNDLRKYLKLPSRVVMVWDFGQQLAEVDKDVLDYFH